MSFSYQNGANPQIDYPRMLISDTTETINGERVYAFEDSEILAATAIENSVFNSGMYFSGPEGATNLPANPPYPWRRIAATLLDCLASNYARIALVSGVLDVKLNGQAAKEMRATAAALREADDNSGAIIIAEQVNNSFSFRDRYWKTIQRQSGGGAGVGN